MHARFALQIERFLHLLERGGDAGFFKPGLDEADQFVLLGSQHGAWLLKLYSDAVFDAGRERIRNN